MAFLAIFIDFIDFFMAAAFFLMFKHEKYNARCSRFATGYDYALQQKTFCTQ